MFNKLFVIGMLILLSVLEVNANELSRYIEENWNKSVRTSVHESYIVDVPIPHTVPSPDGNFKAQFYWDTYFTNLGLIRSNRVELARSNCEALAWWIDKIGFVPNSSFVGDDNRSQPPLLAAMVNDVYESTKDKQWLAVMYPKLEKEYEFWISKRTFKNGLAHFGHNATNEYLLRFYQNVGEDRLKLKNEESDATKIRIAGELLAEAESGTDFSPVYSLSASEFADVKLNSILYVFEKKMENFSKELYGPGERALAWHERAEARCSLVRTLLWDESEGVFKSLNLKRDEFARMASVDTFFPLWAGIASPHQAECVRKSLNKFERPHGCAFTEPYSGKEFQWAYPVVWPPTQWIIAHGLICYGYSEEATRIARKYCAAQETMFRKTGRLWEKYDANEGVPFDREYKADPMLGWTAGVYLALLELR